MIELILNDLAGLELEKDLIDTFQRTVSENILTLLDEFSSVVRKGTAVNSEIGNLGTTLAASSACSSSVFGRGIAIWELG